MVLKKMDSLERSIKRLTERNQTGDSTPIGTREVSLRANELLPLPPTFCDNMDMLEVATTPAYQFMAESFASASHWPADEANFDFTLMDLFDMDFGESDIVLENEAMT